MKHTFHPRTEVELLRLAKQKASAILLSGAEGSGKRTAALWLAAKLLEGPLRTDINMHIISADKKNTISIQAVRDIKKRIKLKQVNSTQGNKILRVVLIENAHFLQEDSQNALLKTLEEPPLGTIFILTTLNQQDLLPTILSRVAPGYVRPITLDQARLIAAASEDRSITQAYHLSGGNVGVFLAILNDSSEHELVKAMNTAKDLLRSNKYQRLLSVEQLQGDGQRIQRTIICIRRILEYKLYTTKDPSIATKIRLCIEAEKDISARVNRRLVLADFFAQM